MDRRVEAQWPGRLAGIDEAGRGPWAGPVVAAAVMLPDEFDTSALADSKTLARSNRERLAAALQQAADIGVGVANVEEIDRHNILNATFIAMRRALAALPQRPDHILVDGNRAPKFGLPATCLIKGDSKAPSIAAASIIAKVHRDAMMAALARLRPEFAWERNAGYGTMQHKLALQKFGPTPYHRQSFRPIRALKPASIEID